MAYNGEASTKQPSFGDSMRLPEWSTYVIIWANYTTSADRTLNVVNRGGNRLQEYLNLGWWVGELLQFTHDGSMLIIDSFLLIGFCVCNLRFQKVLETGGGWMFDLYTNSAASGPNTLTVGKTGTST